MASTAAPPIHYRIGGPEFLPVIAPLWEELRAHHLPWLSPFLDAKAPLRFEARRQEILARSASGGRCRVELACVPSAKGTETIGYCVTTLTGQGRGEIDSMFVKESYRGGGIGSALMKNALRWLDSTGAQSKLVCVAFANEEGLAFYRRFGFQPRTVLLQQTN